MGYGGETDAATLSQFHQHATHATSVSPELTPPRARIRTPWPRRIDPPVAALTGLAHWGAPEDALLAALPDLIERIVELMEIRQVDAAPILDTGVSLNSPPAHRTGKSLSSAAKSAEALRDG